MRGPLPRFPSVRLRGAIHLMKRQESDLPIAKSTYRERTRRRNVLTVLCLKRVNQLVKRFTAGRPLHRGVSLQPRKSGCFRIFPHYFVFFFFCMSLLGTRNLEPILRSNAPGDHQPNKNYPTGAEGEMSERDNDTGSKVEHARGESPGQENDAKEFWVVLI